jgi:probable addiction module antidote protein
LRYVAGGEPMMKAQCHCRECQYISGGAPNLFMLMPLAGFRYSKGAPKQFTRSDPEGAVTREFRAECGAHVITRRPGLPAAILKVGALDDPGLYGGAQMAIFTIDSQPLALAIGAVARAQGMSAVAEKAGLSRENLYRALGGDAKPEFGAVIKVLHALGMDLIAQPKRRKWRSVVSVVVG